MNLFSQEWFSFVLYTSLDYVKWIHPKQYYTKSWTKLYQDNFRFYEDECQSNEPETYNFFYSRFLKRK